MLDYYEKQLILYCKGHFGKRKNKLDDLKFIISQFTGIPLTMVEDRHVYHFVFDLFVKLSEKGYMNIHEFYRSLFKGRTNIDWWYAVDQMLNKFALIKVEGLDLGEPSLNFDSIPS
jgi:hypothetical protein